MGDADVSRIDRNGKRMPSPEGFCLPWDRKTCRRRWRFSTWSR